MATYKDKKTGEWYTQFRVRKPDGKLALTKKRGFKSRDAALQYELTHKHESTASESTTFLQMFEYMTIACRASETTTQQRRTRLKKYCKQLINRPMKSLTKADFIAWRDTLPSFGLSTQTQNDVVNLIKQIGRHGWEAYDIPDCTKVLKPFKKPLEEYKEMTILTPQQFQALLDAEENDLLRTFFQFLYMCGCRKGEARCLLKSDFNPQTKTVYIGKSMRRYEVRTTKTGNTRYVPLDNNTAAKLAELASRPGEYLFGDFAPLKLSFITDHFKKDLKKAGLPDCRIHDLRHSSVSFLWAAGVPISEISARIGHSSPRVTMSVYSHLFDNTQSASLNVLNSLSLK